ncbi:Crp/Fnr family transcriptional regulator [Streptomyces sp. NPDC054794]
MPSHRDDDDFEALLEQSSLGSPAARQLRERTLLSRARTVRRITELRNQIAHPNADPQSAVQAARELLRLLEDHGYRTQGEIPDELRSAALLAQNITRSGSLTTPAHEQLSQQWPAHSLLGRLSPRARQELLTLGTEIRFNTGAELLTQGSTDRHVLLLLSGFAKVTATADNGTTALLAVVAAGDTVGELAAMDGTPRSATVTAAGPLTARVLPQDVLHRLLARRPEVSEALTATLANRLRRADQQRLDFLSYPAKERLARLLVELAGAHGSSRTPGALIVYRFTASELAALAGIREPQVHKVLRELRQEGLVETGPRSITIPDLDRLSQLADTARTGP